MIYKSILDKYIEKIIYINLDEASTRKENIIIVLNKIFSEDKIIRFNAIKNHYNGATKSHIGCLKLAIENNWKNVLIIEDDAYLTNNSNKLFEKLIKNKYDVIHFGGQHALFNPITYRLYACHGGIAYLVNNHYYEILKNNYEEGLLKINQAIKNDLNHNDYIFDSYWRILQIKDNWKLLYPPIFLQKKGYSYVNNKIIDFEKAFDDINFKFISDRFIDKLKIDIKHSKKIILFYFLYHLIYDIDIMHYIFEYYKLIFLFLSIYSSIRIFIILFLFIKFKIN